MPLHKDSGGEVAGEENSRDPNDRIEKFDKELTSATIISWVQWQGHPCTSASARMISLFWMPLNTEHFISELKRPM